MPIGPAHGVHLGRAVTEGLPELDHHGLLGPDRCTCTATRSTSATSGGWSSIDCKISSSPETEMQMGMGHPPIGRALAHGIAPEPQLRRDLLELRATCSPRCGSGCSSNAACATTATNAAGADARSACELPSATRCGGRPPTAPTRSASRTGSARVTVGKQADLIVVGGRAPEHDAAGRPRRLPGRAGQPVEREARAGRRALRQARRRAAAASTSRRDALARCLERVSAKDLRPGPAAAPAGSDGFADAINTVAPTNLARAWAMLPRTSLAARACRRAGG